MLDSLGLEEEDGAVTQVEVDEVLGLVRNEASKVPADDAMPCSPSARVELESAS